MRLNAEVGLYGLRDILLDQWDMRRNRLTAGRGPGLKFNAEVGHYGLRDIILDKWDMRRGLTYHR